jgi:hypothetical protein
MGVSQILGEMATSALDHARRHREIVLEPADGLLRTGLYENRIRFTLALQAEAPHILLRLRDQLLPLWRRAFYSPASQPMKREESVEIVSPEVTAFLQAFFAWLTDTHLQTQSQWLERFAYRTLHSWAVDPALCEGDDLFWIYPAFEIRRRPRKRQTAERLSQHFHWLARRQVFGHGGDAIVNEERRRFEDAGEAQKAINDLRRRSPECRPPYQQILAAFTRHAHAGLAERVRDRSKPSRDGDKPKFRLSRQGVERAIESLAKYLDLTLRRGKRGKPKIAPR